MNRKYGERQSRNFDDHAVRVPILSVIAAFKVLRSPSKTLLTPLVIQHYHYLKELTRIIFRVRNATDDVRSSTSSTISSELAGGVPVVFTD
ncbi:hypothetical protein QCA50_014914 [Cerrena zonata]|uniref:Uncharacterized protein n=1 Tax=Cerrena zonata TaxID=2478898 RepID=A0AAW0FPA5_9APHY